MVNNIQTDTAGAMNMMEGRRQQVELLMNKVKESNNALEDIVRLVRDEETMVQQISQAVEQQAHASKQVSSTMRDISSFSHYAQSAGEQTAQACGNLSRLATELQHSAQGFRLQD